MSRAMEPDEALWRERLARELEAEMLWLVPNVAARVRDVFKFSVTTCADIVRHGPAKNRPEMNQEGNK